MRIKQSREECKVEREEGRREEKRRCKSCKTKLSIFSFTSLCKCRVCAGYSCKNCARLMEKVSICHECNNILTATTTTAAPTTVATLSNSSLLVEYNKFTFVKERIEHLLSTFTSSCNSNSKNIDADRREILNLFSKFDLLKVQIEQSLSFPLHLNCIKLWTFLFVILSRIQIYLEISAATTS